jgi:dihydropyrimidine dehydrogenase (NAD+) subunit PreT
LGAEQVYMVYRRSEKEMPAYEFEFELAKNDGVQFLFQTAPKRVIGKKHVEALECIRMKLGAPDKDGRRKPVPVPRSEFKLPVDMVIKSVGQNIEDSFLSQIPNLKTKSGTVVVNPETYQTTNPKYFAGGDCINGGKEVVNAAYDGKRAAHGIHKFLFSK